MPTILGLFFFIIVIVLIFGLSIISGILRLLFGFGRKRGNNKQQREQQNSYHSNEESDTFKGSVQQNRKKIFDKNEGEYIDFEEVKDDKK